MSGSSTECGRSARSSLAVFFSASLLGLLAGATTGNVGPAADLLAGTYSVPLASVGLLSTGLLLVHSMAQVPAGNWTQRMGPRRSAALAVGVLALGNLVLACVSNFGVALGVRSCMGLGTAGVLLSGSGFMRLRGDSPLAQGWLGGMGMGGSGVAIALVPRLEPLLGWRAPYLFCLGLALASLVPLIAAPEGLPSREESRASLRSALRLANPSLYRLALIHSGSFAVSVIAGAWAVPLLTRDGFRLQQAGTAASLILLGGVMSRPLGGWLLRRHPGSYATLVLVSMVAVMAGLALIVAPGVAWQRTIGCGLMGLATGAPFGLVFNNAAVARPESPLMAIGLVNMTANLVAALGVFLMGLLFLAPALVAPGFLALGVFSLLSASALVGYHPASAGSPSSPAGVSVGR